MHQRFEQALLIVGHPGHELRVHHWLELAQPAVCVLTDGSGGSASPRIEGCFKLLERVGATAGPVMGVFSDRELYTAIMQGCFAPLLDAIDSIADHAVATGASVLIGDEMDGYNPVHDLAHLTLEAVSLLVGLETGRQPRVYDFSLVGAPDACQADRLDRRADRIVLRLEPAALARKQAAARDFPGLSAEVEATLDEFGEEAFAVECLRPVYAPERLRDGPVQQPPYYETYGAKQVEAGLYAIVLRYREHMRPLSDAILAHVERRTRRAPSR